MKALAGPPTAWSLYTNRDQKVTLVRPRHGGPPDRRDQRQPGSHPVGPTTPSTQVTDLWDGRTNHTVWHYNQYGWLRTSRTPSATRSSLHPRPQRPGDQPLDAPVRQYRLRPRPSRQRPNRSTIRNLRSALRVRPAQPAPDDGGCLGHDHVRLHRRRAVAERGRPLVQRHRHLRVHAGSRTDADPDRSPAARNWQQTYAYDNAWRLQSLSSPAGSFGYGFRRSTLHAPDASRCPTPPRLPTTTIRSPAWTILRSSTTGAIRWTATAIRMTRSASAPTSPATSG